MKVIAFALVACLLAAAVHAQTTQIPFVFEASGSCKETSSAIECTLKGATERIDSVVNSHDAVKTSVKTSIGTQAFVYWLASTNGEQYTASGNITYGTHSGQPHSMEFMTSGFIYDNLLVDYGTITGGTGLYENSTGVMSFTTYADGPTFVAWVSGVAEVSL